jgi:uncharacterized membrane protein YqjE
MSNNVYNIGDRRPVAAEHPIAKTMHEVAREMLDFVETRFAMLQAETREKLANLKAAAPLLIVGALSLVSVWLLVTAALVAALNIVFAGNAYGPFLSLVIIACLYAVIGGGALWMASGRIRAGGIMPARTIEVLKEDKVWLENEARLQKVQVQQDARTQS